MAVLFKQTSELLLAELVQTSRAQPVRFPCLVTDVGIIQPCSEQVNPLGPYLLL